MTMQEFGPDAVLRVLREGIPLRWHTGYPEEGEGHWQDCGVPTRYIFFYDDVVGLFERGLVEEQERDGYTWLVLKEGKHGEEDDS
jgi:hypothetical protein